MPAPPSSAPPHVCRCNDLPPDPDRVRLPMVAWYDPGQLFNTGVQVLISAALGTRVDERRLEGIFAGQRTRVHDYSEQDELWFDYTADVGDGGRSTLQIGHLLAREAVCPAGVDRALPRGRFLILGGDQVYPFAGRITYQERLVDVYQEAWDRVFGEPWKPGMKPRAVADIFAVPGNHDWYDGLVSFTRLFCQDPRLKSRYIGEWCAAQGHSYFAIKLPHHWWLWAVDIQLESDIDELQLLYFTRRSRQLEPGDKVILCTAEPDWVLKDWSIDSASNLTLLRRDYIEAAGAQLVLTLAGDLHHYRRHQLEGADRHKIIAGGGGAFLHPTHAGVGMERVLKLPEGNFGFQKAFPDAATSASLMRRILLFPYYNPTFCWIPVGVYLLLTWGLAPITDWYDLQALVASLRSQQGAFVRQTTVTTWAIATGVVLLGRLVAKRQERRRERFFRWWGVLHGLLHVLVAWVLSVSLQLIFQGLLGPRSEQLTFLALQLVAFIAASALFGSILVGLYLYTSLSWFGKHHNDAFSALRYEGFKNFLRLHITPDGALEVFPIGVREVKDHPCEARPELIEGPVVIPPPVPTAPAGPRGRGGSTPGGSTPDGGSTPGGGSSPDDGGATPGGTDRPSGIDSTYKAAPPTSPGATQDVPKGGDKLEVRDRRRRTP